MFTTEHFIWLGICTLLIIVLSIISIKKKFSFKTSALIMAGVSFISEFSKIMSHMELVDAKNPAEGMVIDPKALPLHLCSILIFAYFYLPFSKNKKIRDYILGLVIPVGLIGATLALVMATSGTRFNNIEAYQCFIYHAFMIWFSIYLIKTQDIDLGKKVWLRNIFLLFLMSLVMIWVNGALKTYDTNFWFVVKPPQDGLPLLNLNNGWYVYYLTLLAIGFVGATIVHYPFMTKERKNKSL